MISHGRKTANSRNIILIIVKASSYLVCIKHIKYTYKGMFVRKNITYSFTVLIFIPLQLTTTLTVILMSSLQDPQKTFWSSRGIRKVEHLTIETNLVIAN